MFSIGIHMLYSLQVFGAFGCVDAQSTPLSPTELVTCEGRLFTRLPRLAQPGVVPAVLTDGSTMKCSESKLNKENLQPIGSLTIKTYYMCCYILGLPGCPRSWITLFHAAQVEPRHHRLGLLGQTVHGFGGAPRSNEAPNHGFGVQRGHFAT